MRESAVMLASRDLELDPSYWRARLRAKGLALGGKPSGAALNLLETCNVDLVHAATNAAASQRPTPIENVPVEPGLALLLKEVQAGLEVLVNGSIAELLHAGVPLAGSALEDVHLDEQQQQSGGQPWWELVSEQPDLEASFGLTEPPPLCTIEGLASLMAAALLALERYQSIAHGAVCARLSEPGPQTVHLRQLLADLHPAERQVGVDDLAHAWYDAQQSEMAAAVTHQGTKFMCRKFACTGVPTGHRRRVWEAALGLQSQEAVQQDLFSRLCKRAAAQQLLSDLFVEGAIQSVVNTEHFFLFEDPLRAVLLAFSHDPSIATACSCPPPARLCGRAPDGGPAIQFPPSGVLPHQSLALLAAPLCYLYSSPAGVYCMFRALYCRYWCRLQCVQPQQESLVHLCLVCGNILQEMEPEVMAHMAALHTQLLPVVLPWLATAFVGYLPPSQVLLLWDRVVGFDTVLVLPCMAAAIVSFRRHLLLRCKSAESVAQVLEDLSELQAIPLLQALLFGI